MVHDKSCMRNMVTWGGSSFCISQGFSCLQVSEVKKSYAVWAVTVARENTVSETHAASFAREGQCSLIVDTKMLNQGMATYCFLEICLVDHIGDKDTERLCTKFLVLSTFILHIR